MEQKYFLLWIRVPQGAAVMITFFSSDEQKRIRSSPNGHCCHTWLFCSWCQTQKRRQFDRKRHRPHDTKRHRLLGTKKTGCLTQKDIDCLTQKDTDSLTQKDTDCLTQKDTDCLTQNGNAHGWVFATFLQTRPWIHWKTAVSIFHPSIFHPFLCIAPVMFLSFWSPLTTARE